MSGWARLFGLALVVGSLAGATNVAATVIPTTVLYDTTGGAENGGDPLAAAGPVLADQFMTTNAASDLTSVTLNLSSTGSSASGFTVDLFSATGAGPGTATLLATVADSSLTGSFQLLTYAVKPIALAANTAYYIGIQDLGGSTAVLGNTVDPTVLARPSVTAGADYYNNGGVQANAGGPYELVVNTAVPEPAVWALMLIGVGCIGFKARSDRRSAFASA